MSSNFRFDHLKGRISPQGTTPVPTGLSTPTVKEPTKLIWAQKPHGPAPGFWDDYPRNRVKRFQMMFQQKADGLPVHLKKGMPDKMVYAAAMGLTLVGSIWACYSLYKLAQKD
ncbi:Cytochrome c oxidase subunit 7A-related protein, mitochondrial [Holothuria leucospilota]|uniref:Cytochrome c oxidase subunit 7A-related protein, mitochondrial n=1 Tax=Holothuria leucospilota TaxID=206669 RepID=A0A9Q1CJG6_HOLLE|nr:Cytochrome c oxidase subunit 7A-related protein, mitochondrial [Holothuria leucospilota]